MSSFKNNKKDITAKDVNGLQKAALLMIAMDVDTASQVLKYMDLSLIHI